MSKLTSYLTASGLLHLQLLKHQGGEAFITVTSPFVSLITFPGGFLAHPSQIASFLSSLGLHPCLPGFVFFQSSLSPPNMIKNYLSCVQSTFLTECKILEDKDLYVSPHPRHLEQSAYRSSNTLLDAMHGHTFQPKGVPESSGSPVPKAVSTFKVE